MAFYRSLFLATLLVCTDAQRTAPSISAEGNGDVIMTASADAQVLVRRFNSATGQVESSSPVVTVADMSAAISTAVAVQAGVTSSNADAVELQSFNSFADIEASASTTRASLLSTMARLQDELSTVAATLSELQSGQPAGTCQGYTLANGTAYGAGLGHGATRVLQCNNGSVIVPNTASPIVICHVDGFWSDNQTTRCVLASEAPAPAPPAPPGEQVTCCVKFDQTLEEVWSDGNRVRISRISSAWAGALQMGLVPMFQFSFPATAEVLGLKGWADGGCNNDAMILSCSTPSGLPTRWNMYSPGHGEATDDWQGTVNQYSRRWTGRRTRRADNNYPIGAAGRWAASDYTALSTRGFGGVHIGGNSWPNFYGSNNPNWTRMWNATTPPPGWTRTCNPPDLDTMEGGHLEMAVASMCIGDMMPPFNECENTARPCSAIHDNWWFRYDSLADP